jgi:hypothetical protein
MPPHLITLDVSGRIYKTSKATLLTSDYFKNLFARWDSSTDLQEDGSYFVDADADTFEHILAFMRRPSRFPLYWTREHGFDYVLYNKVEAEADYFLLHDLRDWVRAQRYLDAVKTVVEVKVLDKRQAGAFAQSLGDQVEVQSFFGSYSGERRERNLCPVHGHGPFRSCASCMELLEKHGMQYDEPQKKLTLVIKKVVFDETVCCNDEASG